MKAFLAAALFFAVALAISAIFFSGMSTSTSEAFSVQNARIDHIAPRDGRLDWAAGVDGDG
jgi:hypothetical protein